MTLLVEGGAKGRGFDASAEQAGWIGERRSRLLLVLFSVMVAAYCVWVLSLPLFPSQDGPLHLYYVDVFGRFLAHAPGEYARFYRVGSYLPPYALYWYLLWALKSVVSLPVADKLVVCCSILLNAFGFRYLAKRVGEGGGVAAFLILPVLLNWPLAMGFVNFTLSFGMALWAGGLWARLEDDRRGLRRFGFVLLLYLIAITHPIPLAILLLGCGVDVVVRAVRLKYWRAETKARWDDLSPRVLCLAAALPAALYIRRFTKQKMLEQRQHESFHRHVSDGVFNFLHGAGLLVFPGDAAMTMLYRVGVGCLLLGAVGVGAWHAWRCWRERGLDGSALWLGAAVVCAVNLPLLPHDLNGSQFFAWRLVLVVYLALALGATGNETRRRGVAAGIVGAALALSGAALAIASVRMGGVARQIAALGADGRIAPGQVGVVVQVGDHGQHGLNYRPFYWAGMHYFRRNGLILYNAAWLDGPQIPLKPNEETNLLEPTEDQMAPRFSDSPDLFAPGGRWNPRVASFFFIEQIAPAYRPGAEENSWRNLQSPVSGLSTEGCRPSDWYCLAPRD